MNGYYDVDGVEAAIAALENTYPAFCKRVPLIHLTIKNRQTHALRIGDPIGWSKNGVLLMACAHANEWGGAEICLGFASDLLGAYVAQTSLSFGQKSFTLDEVNSIVKGVDLFVYPLINPDGRQFSQGGDTNWRKNLNPGPGGAIGVDLNRNYGFLWDQIPVGASPSVATSRYYRGTKADSERETKNVQFLIESQPHIRRILDIHSDGQHVIWGWSDDELQDVDPTMNFLNSAFDGQRGGFFDSYKEYMPPVHQKNAKAVAERLAAAINAVRGKQYTLLGGGGYYETGVFGTATDYFYSRQFVNPQNRRIDAWGIEFGEETPISSWPEMELVIADVSAGLFQFCLDARYTHPGAFVAPELPTWVELMHLVSELVRIVGGIPAGGPGIVIPLGGVPEPVPSPTPYFGELVERLDAIIELLSESRR